MSKIKVVGVVGAGTMGNGIAHVFARSGFQVVLCEVEQRFLDRGLEAIRKNLEREAAKGKLTAAEAEAALKLIRGTLQAQDLVDLRLCHRGGAGTLRAQAGTLHAAGCAAEAGGHSGFQHLFHFHHPAGGTDPRPGQVIGMHFFNPVPVMKLVEVIRGLETSDETFAQVKALAEALGKSPVEVNDAPGFVSNRVLMPLLNEAMYAVMEGVATPAAVDQVFQLGMAHPMGPLALADFIGLDVCLDIMRVMVEGLGDPKYRPCPLLIRMVDAGWLGRKSGRGFYQY